MKKDKICPFLKKQCVEKECGIWDIKMQSCSIRAIAYQFYVGRKNKQTVLQVIKEHYANKPITKEDIHHY